MRIPASLASGGLLLAIDVGNTSIAAGVFRGRRLISSGRIPTRKLGSPGRRPASAKGSARALRALLRTLRVSAGDLQGVIISSVVPQVTGPLVRALQAVGLPRPQVLGRDLQAPVVNLYRIPSQVGQDRLVNAAAACFLYKGPAIVVDFGTAVTIDLVNGRGEYRGGMIVPGLEISLEALATRTALLPRIPLAPPKEFLGRDTRSSMASGLFFGFGALCDGLVRRLKAQYAPRAVVIATGGHAALIAPFCRTVQKVNSELTLQGLALTYEKSC